MDAFHVPGIDVVFRQVYPPKNNAWFARFATAAAIRNRRREALCEAFNVYGYGVTPPVMNWVASDLFSQGINRILVMPYLYSDRKKRKICCSTDFSPRVPQWDAMQTLVRFWKWCGAFFAGAFEAPVWVLAHTAHPTTERNVCKALHIQAENNALRILKELSDHGIFYRLADLSDLQSGKTASLLIVPSISQEVKTALKSYTGRVVSDIPADIDAYCEIDIINGKGCRLLPCLRKNGRSLMIFNPSDHEVNFIFCDHRHWCEELPPDPVFSEYSPLLGNDGQWEILLPPGGIRIIRALQNDVLRSYAISPIEIGAPIELHLKFAIKSVERMHLSLTGKTRFIRSALNSPLPASGNYCDVDSDFSGRILLESFIISPFEGEAFLLFESISHYARVALNGQDCGERAFAPWMFRVKMKMGENLLQLQISGSAGNEFRRCFREELQPAGWFNVYAKIIKGFEQNDGRCGLDGSIRLIPIFHSEV